VRGRRRAQAVGVALLLAGSGGFGAIAWARSTAAPPYRGDAPGSVTCTLRATVSFSPRLTGSGGGTNPSAVRGHLSHCSTSDSVVKITRGVLTGSFAPGNHPSCTSLSDLTTPATFSIGWKGFVDGVVGTTTYGGRAALTPSAVSSASERLSTVGGGDLQLVAPANQNGAAVTGSFAGGASATAFTNVTPGFVAARCASNGKGFRTVNLEGTVTVGVSQAEPLTGATTLASDSQQSFCAVTAAGMVRCWGDNEAGQLGDGTTASASVALSVTGITNADAVVSDGADSFCAALTTGAVDCWGANASGELGDGTTSGSSVPVGVTGITGAVALSSAGEGSYCAVLGSGSVECWGNNVSGQLGDGTTLGSSVPVAVTGIDDAVAVTSDGNGSFCAVLTTGAVDCWGANLFGQLGDNSTAQSSVPVAVSGITDASSISSDGDDSFCALLTTGLVECWGANFSGELGNGTSSPSSTPVAVTGLTGVTQLVGAIHSAGDTEHTYCAIGTRADVYCWGSNAFGELGDATTIASSTPQTVLQP
jgi:alpha-tubulin suppressor-like RCC1 family protein